MIFYLVLLACILLFPNRKQICILFLFLFGIMSGIRYDIGYDYINYYDIIVGNYQYDTMYDRLEPTTKILIDLSRNLYFPQLYFIVTSFSTLFMVCYIIRRESFNCKLSILLFLSIPMFFWATLSIIRQMWAVSFGMLFFYYYEKNKIRSAIVFLLLAVLTHSSAIVLLLIPFFRKMNLKFSHYVFLYLSSFFLSFIIPVIFSYNIQSDLFIRAKQFIFSDIELKGYASLVVLFNLVYVISLFLYEKCIKDYAQTKYYFLLFSLGIFVFNILHPFGVIGGRLSTYFLIVIIILVPNLIERSSLKYLVTPVVYAMLIVIYVYTIYLASSSYQKGITDKDPYCPYKTFMSL